MAHTVYVYSRAANNMVQNKFITCNENLPLNKSISAADTDTVGAEAQGKSAMWLSGGTDKVKLNPPCTQLLEK